MKTKWLMIFVCIVLTSLLVVACQGGSTTAPTTPSTPSTTTPTKPAEKTWEWRLTSTGSPGAIQYIASSEGLARLIEEGSGGRVKCTAYPSGAIASAMEMASAVRDGTIEILHGHAGMFPGVPSCALTEVAFMFKDIPEMVEFLQSYNVEDVINTEMEEQGLYFLSGCASMGDVVMFTTFPINTVDDLKGKLAWLSPADLFFADFGFVPTEVPGFDMYMGMKLGTIDGFNWSIVGLESENLKEVVDYMMMPILFPSGMNCAVNLDAWNELGPELQNQINDYVDANVLEILQPIIDLENEILQKIDAGDYPVKVVTPKEEDMVKMIKSARNYLENTLGKSSPASAELVELYKQFAKDKGLIW